MSTPKIALLSIILTVAHISILGMFILTFVLSQLILYCDVRLVLLGLETLDHEPYFSSFLLQVYPISTSLRNELGS